MNSAETPETDVNGNSDIMQEVSRLQTILCKDDADGQMMRNMMDRWE